MSDNSTLNRGYIDTPRPVRPEEGRRHGGFGSRPYDRPDRDRREGEIRIRGEPEGGFRPTSGSLSSRLLIEG